LFERCARRMHDVSGGIRSNTRRKQPLAWLWLHTWQAGGRRLRDVLIVKIALGKQILVQREDVASIDSFASGTGELKKEPLYSVNVRLVMDSGQLTIDGFEGAEYSLLQRRMVA